MKDYKGHILYAILNFLVQYFHKLLLQGFPVSKIIHILTYFVSAN